MNETYKKAMTDFEEKAERNERLLWDIFHELKEARKGDENDIKMAVIKIQDSLKENGFDMPF
jgi:hypothetical protein